MTHAPPLPDLSQLSDAEKDALIEVRAETCPSCAAALAEGDQKLQAIYERIKLPPIKPIWKVCFGVT